MYEFLSDYSLAGKPMMQWAIALAWIVGGFVFGWLISFISTNILRRLASKTKSHLDDIILAVTQKPLIFIVTIAGIRIGADSLNLSTGADSIVDRIYGVLVTIAIAWVLVRLIDAIVEEYLIPWASKTEGTLDDQLLPIVRKGLKLLVWIFALVMALKNSGYDVGALLAGIGIGGAAIAFAAKDTLSNFFGSLAVFVDRPFGINDRIRVSGIDGFVTELGIRTSRIRTLDNRTVTIPNAIFASSPIENVSSEPNTKVTELLDLTYSAGHEGVTRALDILREIGTDTEGVDGKPVASLSTFAESSLRITFIYFVKKGADYWATVNSVNLAILSRFSEQKLEFAYPTTQIVMSR